MWALTIVAYHPKVWVSKFSKMPRGRVLKKMSNSRKFGPFFWGGSTSSPGPINFLNDRVISHVLTRPIDFELTDGCTQRAPLLQIWGSASGVRFWQFWGPITRDWFNKFGVVVHRSDFDDSWCLVLGVQFRKIWGHVSRVQFQQICAPTSGL